MATEDRVRFTLLHANSYKIVETLLKMRHHVAAGRYIFKIFLESEIADENLKFWLACEELKQATQQKKLEKKVQEIYNTFINVYSPQEVRIQIKIRVCGVIKFE